jgi:cysteine desulfurase
MLAGSAHKIYGPKGVGFLYKDKSIRLEPLIHGGGQEIGLRSGTINVSGVVGLAEAFKLIQHQRDIETKKINEMTTLFIDCLENYGIIFTLNGPKKNRLVGNLNLSLHNVDAAWLTTMLPNIAVARGSACTSETIQPSHVLRAIGLSDDKADCAIRVSFGRFTTKDEVIEAAKVISLKAQEYLSKRESIAI